MPYSCATHTASHHVDALLGVAAHTRGIRDDYLSFLITIANIRHALPQPGLVHLAELARPHDVIRYRVPRESHVLKSRADRLFRQSSRERRTAPSPRSVSWVTPMRRRRRSEPVVAAENRETLPRWALEAQDNELRVSRFMDGHCSRDERKSFSVCGCPAYTRESARRRPHDRRRRSRNAACLRVRRSSV